MTRVLVIRAAARTEIGDAAGWYESQEPGLAAAFLGAVEAILGRVERTPFQFALIRQGEPYRRALVERFPYQVLFEILEERIVVIAVAHER
ncbi:MAG: type II toxin-antitoxin system RelE/ParE family toxin [Pseudomonadota bacterium]|nr:type II toxin-antitoxin system RelE/ParE family toxin [Pseudomonadota bacterium]